MKFYLKQTVYDAALDRIRRLFQEFEDIVVSFSGGKDSTIVLELTLIVARELGRLPVKVMWLDQEVEWQGTVDMVQEVMTRPEVDPIWLQIPIKISNNASSYEEFHYCWEEGKPEKWMREKHPIARTENVYGTDRFHQFFSAFAKHEFPAGNAAFVAGVRAEESPKRLMSLTSSLTYKDITWGKKLEGGNFTFYPIYDWSYTDVWKTIHNRQWPYCKVYDDLYRHGVAPRDMRISNLHHETAIQNLLLVQEIEPDTWGKITDKVAGASAIKHLKNNSYRCPKKLPYMFDSWQEYAIYLNEHIVQEPDRRAEVTKRIHDHKDLRDTSPKFAIDYYKKMINCILSSDWDFTKMTNFLTNVQVQTLKKLVLKGVINDYSFKYSKYLPDTDTRAACVDAGITAQRSQTG